MVTALMTSACGGSRTSLPGLGFGVETSSAGVSWPSTGQCHSVHGSTQTLDSCCRDSSVKVLLCCCVARVLPYFAVKTKRKYNNVSGKSRLNAICRLKPLVMFSVKLRNSSKGNYFRHLTRTVFPEAKGIWASSESLIFLEGKALKSRPNTICRLKLLVMLSVKLRNSFKGNYFRRLTRTVSRNKRYMSKFRVLHFSRGESVVHSRVERM